MEIVSVLIPLFNNAEYIESALNSLLEECPHRIELLVLDDGSVDSSWSIVNKWISENGSKFYSALSWSRENRGISATLNELVLKSAGQYVTILPADDEFLPGGIDARIDALKHNPKLLCVFGDARVVDASGVQISDSALFKYPKKHVAARGWALRNPTLFTLELIIRWSVPGPVFLAHRDIYSVDNGIGLYDESLAAEDRDYYLRNIASNTIGFVDRQVAKYRVHGANVSTEVQTREAVKRSVFESEKKNLELFTGINRFALSVVYRYKRSVGNYMATDGLIKKWVFMTEAVSARILMRLLDVVQLGRKFMM